MKAVRIHAYGSSDVLVYEDAPDPVAATGEVLVRVRAAGVNPVDWKTRRGAGLAGRLGDFPIILGWDVAGTVVAPGPGVTGFREGDAVYSLVRFPQQGAAYAEYVTVPADQLARQPASLDAVQAAAVPLAALTAWQALFEAARLEAGQKVLIHAAAGGVGHFAAQLARWKGAYVIGTASGHNTEFLHQLGVDQVIDYTTTPFEQVACNVDVVLDLMGGETRARSWAVLKPGGILVALVGGLAAEEPTAHGVRGVGMRVRPDAAQLIELAALIESGVVAPYIHAVFPLAEAKKAHDLGEQGHTRGKIVLRVVE